MIQPNVSILVDSSKYSYWKSVDITRAVDAISGSFSMSVSWPSVGSVQKTPVEQDVCSVVVGGKKLITGSIDERKTSLSESDHAITVTGRDAASKLVDCSCDLGAWEFKNTAILSFFQKVAGQFNVPVSVGPGVTLPDPPGGKISITPGEKAFAVIDRISKYSGFLPVSDGLGGVVITKPGQTVAPVKLVEGENIKLAKGSFSVKNRYYKYKVYAQPNGYGSKTVVGEAIDSEILDESRVFIVNMDGASDQAGAKSRAEWERDSRAGRADSVTGTVTSWEPVSGYLWTPGDLVSIDAPMTGVTGRMMISRVALSLRDGGRLAALTLVRPDAFMASHISDRKWKK